MKPEANSGNDPRLLPEGALPCIWMTAGLIAWKLCERELDCQACPLDAAIQSRSRRMERSGFRDHDPAEWEFPDDRSYHPTHSWIQRVGNDRVRFGVDVFASRLLARATSVILPPVRSQVRRDRAACWIVEDAELVPIPAPMTGIVHEINTILQYDPSLIGSHPYSDGWLFEIAGEESAEIQEEMIEAGEMREQSQDQLAELREYVLQEVSEHADIGRTAADGGEPIADLHRILPTEKYLALILRYIG
ncbi:glycine cleavage system protein H [Candidatus Zixiibacteriota bacterium]